MLIGHYQGLWEKSGVAAYIRRIIDRQKAGGHRVIYFDKAESAGLQEHFPTEEPVLFARDDEDLYEKAMQEGVDVLHAHHTLAAVPPENLAVVRTVHNHRPYCPSRFRYLPRQDVPCPRKYSLTGCLWGMVVDGCNGHLQPNRWAGDFSLTNQERRVLPHVRTVTVSAFVREQLLRSGYPDDGVSVLHLPAPPRNAVPEAIPESTGPEFLFMGRFERPKGVRWLVDSFAHVRPPAILHFAGDGEEEPVLRDRAGKLGISDRIVFHGWLSEEPLADLMRRVRALVFPSMCHEAGGTAAFEAMAYGKPVIMSRVGGMPEVVQDGVNGLIIEPGDRKGLAKAMNTLADDGARAAEMGRVGMGMVEKQHGLAYHMDQLMRIYREALEKAGRPPAVELHQFT